MICQDLACSFELKAEGDDTATFVGVASTADVDLQNEIIEPGAFDPINTKKAPSGETIPDVLMLRDHDRSQVIGGWRTFQQHDDKLVVEGELALEVPKARETYALIKKGYLSGLSVGYTLRDPKGMTMDKSGRRVVKRGAGVLRECSIVSFPANRGAQIVSVKSELNDWLVERGFNPEDLEGLLRLYQEAKAEAAFAEKDDASKPYGSVRYADPGYLDHNGDQASKSGLTAVKRYPIDTEAHIRAAWNYFQRPKNRNQYTPTQRRQIEGRIIAAWKRVIDKDGPPSTQEDKEFEPIQVFKQNNYADPGYLEDEEPRYPLDTEARIRAAWDAIQDEDTRSQYSDEQIGEIEDRIIAAWKRVIDENGPPDAEDETEKAEEVVDEEQIAEALGLLKQLKGRYCHV